MYQHILLAVALQRWDTLSPYALVAREVAVALAKGSGAKLSVLSIYDYELLSVYGDDRLTPPGLPPELITGYWEDHRHAIDAMMAAKMEAFLAGIRGADLPIAPILAVGEPRETIVAMAETLRADLLIIGTHSKRHVFNVVLGGTAAHVSRHAACPVLMVKPGERTLAPVRA
jgi:nucleotide-binding universal stress UspA family protein